MGMTIAKDPCSACGSKDNLRTWVNEEGREIQTCVTPDCNGPEGESTGNCVTSPTSIPTESIIESSEPMFGMHLAIEDRCISAETCKYYDYQILDKYHIMNYPKGDQKVRIGKGKDKINYWNKNKTKVGLFGISIATLDKNCDIIVTEGEIDAMSIYDAENGYVNRSFNVVSLRDGASHLLAELEAHKDILQTFKSVIVCVDTDDNQAGQKALKKAIAECSFKFRICKMPLGVDPNDMHCQGKDEELLELLNKADYIRPSGLVMGSELDFDDIMVAEQPGLPTQFPLFNELTGGIHKSRIMVIGAGTGSGKSTFMREIAYHLIKTQPGIKIANLFLEEKQKTTVQAYVALDNDVPLKEFSKNTGLITPEQLLLSKQRFSSDNLMFTSKAFELNSKELFSQLEYLSFCKKYDIIILDHISMVAGSSNVSRNGERRDIDDLMYKLASIVTKSDTTIIAAVHLTDPQKGKDYEEGRIVKMSDFRGSGAIKQVMDVGIGIERDVMNPQNQTKAQLRVLKNRPTSSVGPADLLYYMETTGRYLTR